MLGAAVSSISTYHGAVTSGWLPAGNQPGQNGQSTGCTFSACSELRKLVTAAGPVMMAVNFNARRKVSPVCRRVSLPVRLRSYIAGREAVTSTPPDHSGWLSRR